MSSCLSSYCYPSSSPFLIRLILDLLLPSSPCSSPYRLIDVSIALSINILFHILLCRLLRLPLRLLLRVRVLLGILFRVLPRLLLCRSTLKHMRAGVVVSDAHARNSWEVGIHKPQPRSATRARYVRGRMEPRLRRLRLWRQAPVAAASQDKYPKPSGLARTTPFCRTLPPTSQSATKAAPPKPSKIPFLRGDGRFSRFFKTPRSALVSGQCLRRKAAKQPPKRPALAFQRGRPSQNRPATSRLAAQNGFPLFAIPCGQCLAKQIRAVAPDSGGQFDRNRRRRSKISEANRVSHLITEMLPKWPGAPSPKTLFRGDACFSRFFENPHSAEVSGHF